MDTTLTATITPADATDTTFTWSSANDTIASVNSEGVVTAIKPGTATIIATTTDGGLTAESVITVTASSVPVTGIEISPASVELAVGMNTTLTATITPADATDTTFTWSSVNDTIASVDSEGVVTAIKPGTATIVATTTDGGLTAESVITVTASSVPVTGIEINPATVELEEGMDTTLTATIIPANATDTTFTWSSVNDTIASVDSKGVVTAIKPGTATIVATTTDGGLTAESVITVTARDNTGIYSLEEKGISVYPNPVKDLLYFENVKDIQQISVMDIMGRKVKSVNNPEENQIDLSSLANGIYLVTLHTEEGEIYTRKVIKK